MTEPTFNKNPQFFHQRIDSLETKPELLTDFITPNNQFFVCKVVDSPRIDLATYTLKIDGNGVRHPLALTYDAILQLPSYEDGNTQPLEQPFNAEGYLFNRIFPHPVIVKDE